MDKASPLTAIGAALLALIVLGTSAPAGATPFVDYLYMEPNEGGSSAGHVALALGDRTYAFQRSPTGGLVLERDATDHLRYLYAVLGNRAVHRSRVAVSPATFERLREGFNLRYVIQQRQRTLMDRLALEAHLLRVLTARRRDPRDPRDGLMIEAAGYFADGASAALRALRADVAATYGPSFVAERLTEARARLVTTVPTATTPESPHLAVDVYPADDDRFVTRYTATASALVAFGTLQTAPGLDPAGIVVVDDGVWSDADARALSRYGARLRASLVRLVGSTRSDVGFPLLVGMARLAAVERSLAERRLVVLDTYPPNARRLPPAVLAAAPDAAQGLLADAGADLAASRQRLAAATEPDERAYGALETAANRVVELRRGRTEEREVRVTTEAMLPVRPTRQTDLVVPDVAPALLAAAAEAAAVTARRYATAFDDLYRYDLVRRNCVTETFRTIDTVLGDDADAALGGRVAMNAWRAIPAVATRAVRRTWRVTASDTTPSYRQERVAALARAGNPLAVRLRESNTLTSTVYRRSRDDSAFLFFTDDVLLLRPLLGAANLGVGMGASVLGILQAPLDRGAALQAGLRGVLWSVPELFFVNVRKGSFDWVARASQRDWPRDSIDAPPWRESPPPSPQ